MTQNKDNKKFDIVIIGGGPGGYVAAIKAAMLGAKVAVVEKEFMGGICLNVGCIPTKALVRSAEIFENVKSARSYGIKVKDFEIDMKKVISRKNRIVRQLTMGTKQLVTGQGAQIFEGSGYIIDKNTVRVTTEDDQFELETDKIIIATGAKPTTLNISVEEDNESIIFSRQALDIKDLPDSMIIVGGGVIGMEFAFIYSIFGVKVTVVEYQDRILSILDEDVTDELMRIARRKRIEIITGAAVQEIKNNKDDRCTVIYNKDDEEREIEADKVLLSVGRMPYTEELGLENIDIEMNDGGRGIKVNNRMETNISGIYAVGDVTNKIQLAHVASHQGIVAVENIMGNDMIMDYSAIPWAIFTEPEISVVGITEKQANEEGKDVLVGKFPFSASGKALVEGSRDGFVKVIKDKESDMIIGATMIGPHASDLISELTVAIQNGLTAEQISHTIHAHPTTAEAVHEAVLATNGKALHFIKG